MNTIATDNGTIIVYANPFDGAILEVVSERPKAIEVVNRENRRKCWIPKSGLALRKPNVPTYENEYDVKDWFYNKLSSYQQRALNLLD